MKPHQGLIKKIPRRKRLAKLIVTKTDKTDSPRLEHPPRFHAVPRHPENPQDVVEREREIERKRDITLQPYMLRLAEKRYVRAYERQPVREGEKAWE